MTSALPSPWSCQPCTRRDPPLYGDPVHVVSKVDDAALSESVDPKALSIKYGDVASTRLDVERHAAIRLGTPHELRTTSRVSPIIGLLHTVGVLRPVGGGVPMHATCFRPGTQASLHRNPLHVFTSVQRPVLLRDRAARTLAMDLLSRRPALGQNRGPPATLLSHPAASDELPLAVEEAIKFLPSGVVAARARLAPHPVRQDQRAGRGRHTRRQELYDELLDEVMVTTNYSPDTLSAQKMDATMAEGEEWKLLGSDGSGMIHLEKLVEDGMLEALPITYEDFLPLSVAGILQSNLGQSSEDQGVEVTPDVHGMEEALGTKLDDPDEHKDAE
ncbi:DUF1338 [Geosmithia morbida]|uniref:2-oxoadipate dioxygenase/decarboxylase n=1 Tax=Geosmithia morbida TaxID=1094350 RepID=A0A9P5D1Z4_9HYPO|nr:DUF1338 [Geosmithia morbida]KAF4123287.1 DUF1338 [Geosmithia morbida]